jgi:excisionase family DNA binding protein
MDRALTPIAAASFEHHLGRSVSLEQAAVVLGVSRRTIYNWIRDGRLQTIRTLGGSQRVLLESLRDRTGSERSAGPPPPADEQRQRYPEIVSI